MTYLYAGLGIAMLLPIMAGLQFAVAMAERESANEGLLLSGQLVAAQARQQEISYLSDESQLLLKKLADPSLSDFDCQPRSLIGAANADIGFSLGQGYARACSFVTDRPFPYPYKDGVDRKARIYLSVSTNGVETVVDSCLVTSADQRCAVEQEAQPS